MFSARYALNLYIKQKHFDFLGLKEKYIANANLFAKQVDSIAARGPCIFLRVLLRVSCGLRHAVNIEIQKYIMLCSIVWLAWYF